MHSSVHWSGEFPQQYNQHLCMSWIRHISSLKTSGILCQVILLQLRGLQLILSFCHQMSRRTLTILRQRSTLLLPLFLRRLQIMQRLYKMAWMPCKYEVLQNFRVLERLLDNIYPLLYSAGDWLLLFLRLLCSFWHFLDFVSLLFSWSSGRLFSIYDLL